MANKSVKKEREERKILKGWKKTVASYQGVDLTPEEESQIEIRRLQEEIGKKSFFILRGPNLEQVPL